METKKMYRHVQRSPIHLLLHLLAAFCFVSAWLLRNDAAPSIAVLVIAVVLFVFAISFQTLTVSDLDGEQLDVRYGPLNLFGTRVAYKEITDIEPGKTSLLDGWGIHFIPFRGWTFNLWGFECAKIWRGNKIIRIGTDDSENLVNFVREQIAGGD
jgi:hypothetical protein